jgi:hypothetical protein
MQPYFFPYVGYFSLIEYTDRFIFFDTPQYIRHGWINRNRILKEDKTPGYIVVPVKKCSQTTAIKDMKIDFSKEWQKRLWGQLTVYKKLAPYYNQTTDFLHSVIDGASTESLSKLCISSIIKTCEYIGIERQFDTFSEMNMKIDSVSAPDEWALNISKAVGADVYVNPPGGMSFFDKSKYERQNIKLEFLESNLKSYVQRIGHFEKGLSIIDVMMFCDSTEIKEILGDYTIVEA